MISIENLVKSFGSGKGEKEENRALKGVTAVVEGGKITGLVGPDGAGKTTMLRILCGLLLPTGGSVRVMGLDPAANSDAVHNIVGYMPQRFGLYEDLTVMENLNLQADLRNVPKKERAARYEELMTLTGLGPFTARLAGRLSGGMKQKLGLACTFLSSLPVLLLDEPGVGVDPVARRELWRLVREQLTPERVVLWSTAYLDEAETCDSVLLLNEGELLYAGPPADLASKARGQVFALNGAEDKRRSLIAPIMSMKSTLDTVIQGSQIRVVTRDGGKELDEACLSMTDRIERRVSVKPIEPRFEDAFIGILGGARPDNPAVTEFFSVKNTTEAVEARSLTKRFGSFTAVDNVSFSIRGGEIFGLLGPNGAGKSTTFKMLCGLLTPTSGHCSIVGIDFGKAPGDARSRLGYMAQKFSLYGDLSVKENLYFFSGVYGLKGKARENAVGRVVETFGLSRYLKLPAKSLSLGYKQRLAMGCAIMHGPDVLFLDEPTSGVDPVTRREFWTYINAFALRGVTIMVTTHFMDEAEYCDRIALVYNGKVEAMGSPDVLRAEAIENIPDKPNPTLEDAFVSIIERADEAAKVSI